MHTNKRRAGRISDLKINVQASTESKPVALETVPELASHATAESDYIRAQIEEAAWDNDKIGSSLFYCLNQPCVIVLLCDPLYCPHPREFKAQSQISWHVVQLFL